MSENEYVIPDLDVVSIAPLLVRLEQLRDEAAQNEADQKVIKNQLRDALGANGKDSFETPTHTLKMTYPEARKSINREKLLLAGVEIQTILDATDVTDVAPYVNVRKKSDKAQK